MTGSVIGQCVLYAHCIDFHYRIRTGTTGVVGTLLRVPSNKSLCTL